MRAPSGRMIAPAAWGRRRLPEGRGVPADVLSVAKEIRRADAVGSSAAEAARRGNRRLKQMVADLSLDKAMLQDVLSKKP
jgi:hypothetical protein